MYPKKISMLIAVVVISSSLLFTSCKKEAAKDSDTESAEDYNTAESSFNDVTTIADQAALTGSVNMRVAGDAANNRADGSLGSACSTVTVDTVSIPHLISVDFGTANCMCNDGKNRRGKITLSYIGRYKDAGTAIAVSFNNYFVNNNQLTGTETITNLGLNNAGNPAYKIETKGTIKEANGAWTFTWESSRKREWTAGASTPLVQGDDAYSLTGSSSGVNREGKAFTLNISAPLVRKMSCNWLESGRVDLTPEGLAVRTVDFGNGNCDNKATLTINGNVFTFSMN
ncbi:MAG: hypothetical protein ABIU63_05285 [Chitinophagaceae bacterium]